uniref:NADH dehydrogenase [ubiquinone] 1 alpha subcomplex subunit 11 n=1 Tax=Craspedostauros australis TaxID=1486917 RepID=A0A7R9WW37_9STRA|mmetsp:Transcript_22484/g.62746  ORF Transcript_22484/g.62746 Transcript_22484/m.62746 type:complete len:194 (+) Transcript_22484:184-765(+)
MSKSFQEYRRELYETGQDYGLTPISKKLYFATMQGAGAGIAYGICHWAFYPDKFVFSHKNTVLPGPSRGMQYLNATMLRPSIYFTAVSVTFAAVESLLEELRGSHKDPVNTASAGFAAGLVMGGFFTRRFDIAGVTGLGMSLIMGCVELNGPNLITDPEKQQKKLFPESVPVKFEESEELFALKEKYPAYKDN